MKRPIVFVHCGRGEHLHLATRQAKLHNPDSPIVLLGDDSNRSLRFVDQHYCTSDYFDAAARFAERYAHHSRNRVDWERFCFERWFILNEWMDKQGCQSAWIFDSDVLVYSDLDDVAGHFADDALAYCSCSGHAMLVAKRSGLHAFCRFCESMYEPAAEKQQRLVDYAKSQLELDGQGVSDMTALVWFREESPLPIGNLSYPTDGRFFDDNICLSQGYEVADRKRIRWRDGVPYATDAATGDLVGMHAIHFQGNAKKLMPAYSSQPDFTVLGSYLRRKLHSPLHRIRRKFAKVRASQAA
ncbi:hypothetical protein Mal15_02840 [Stieleria maiorica]|uniref:Nucleotide-diphospho-sugar transferase n=1 Tax=Stieleria maiorica TaxID=2795974 RepID=A0A5B9MAK5_9BACT|nr:hypothetical protein [Stieleria maiorica]QEF96257.1 hypothetical protein Mal15_02840 [Stieleria maiorica]